MTITITPETDLEIGKDALAALLLGPEFAKCLETEYARQPVKFPIRYPAIGYIDEVRTLDDYPAFELVAGPSEPADINGPGFVHEISLQWTVNGDKPELMSREVMRLIAASRRFFESSKGSLLPYVGGKFWTERADTGPTSEGRTDQTVNNTAPYVKSASIRVMWRVYGL